MQVISAILLENEERSIQEVNFYRLWNEEIHSLRMTPSTLIPEILRGFIFRNMETFRQDPVYRRLLALHLANYFDLKMVSREDIVEYLNLFDKGKRNA